MLIFNYTQNTYSIVIVFLFIFFFLACSFRTSSVYLNLFSHGYQTFAKALSLFSLLAFREYILIFYPSFTLKMFINSLQLLQAWSLTICSTLKVDEKKLSSRYNVEER